MNIFTLKLKKIDPIKWATIAGLLYAAISLVIVVPFILFFSAIGLSEFDEFSSGFGLLGGGIMILFLPILYGLIGFVFGLIGALIFNFILKKTGGLDMDFEKTGLDISLSNQTDSQPSTNS